MNLDDYIKKKPIILKDCIPVVNSIFTKMNYQLPSIFTLTNADLDLLFASSYFMRTAAPLLNLIHQDLTDDDHMLTDIELAQLASLILGTYKHKWDKYMELAQIEYDPIHNYYDELVETTIQANSDSSSETQTFADTTTRTDNLTNQEATTYNTTDTKNYNSTNTETDLRNITTTTDGTITEVGSIQNGIYGFNSTSAVGDSTEDDTTTTDNDTTVVEAHTGTDTNAKSGVDTETKTGTDSTTSTASGTQAHAKTGHDDLEREGQSQGVKARAYKKLGNIGNLTTQQLINQDLELWEYNFIQKILQDVADFVSLPVYDY